ncbi:MAG TPA: VOC family protein [Croceibacterium sp.]|nr:VOC family protein [Croceibacterium sp.]
MLSHVSLGTNDAARAAAFYDPVLAVLGICKICERDGSVDYGVSKTIFSLEKPSDGKPASVGNGVHIAFDAGTRAQVDEFHRVALAHGGTDAGAPGLRPEYDAHYYGAFVRDPQGNKIEAVSFQAK